MPSLDFESISIPIASTSGSASATGGNSDGGDNNGADKAAVDNPTPSGGNLAVKNAEAERMEKLKMIQEHLATSLHALNCQLRDELIGKSGRNAVPVRFYCL